MYILSKHISWGASGNLYQAFLNSKLKCQLYCVRRSKRDSNRNCSEKYLNSNNIPNVFNEISNSNEPIIIISPTFISTLNSKYVKESFTKEFIKKNSNRIVIYLTGSICYQNPPGINELLKIYGIKHKLCVPEFLDLFPGSQQVFHTVEFPNLQINKNKIFTVTHSSRGNDKKGSQIILEGIQKASKIVDFEFVDILNYSYDECINLKSKSHIFIDQIKQDIGGIGKSGLEAISLDCITLCSVNKLNQNYQESKFYPKHPIIDIQSSEDVCNEIVKLIQDKEYYNNILNQTKIWKKYISYKNTVNRINDFLKERQIIK